MKKHLFLRDIWRNTYLIFRLDLLAYGVVTLLEIGRASCRERV